MYKYEGLVIHQSYDEQGIIEIVDTQGVRALHFGTSARQSSMLLIDPNRLHSLYARAMMAGLLFHDQPKNVLMIGLGGGTIAKFLLHQFADSRLMVVEFRPSVLKIARSHFGLPFDTRLKIKIGCGAEHVRSASRENSELHDSIMIDAYDHAGMAPEVSSETFFDTLPNFVDRRRSADDQFMGHAIRICFSKSPGTWAGFSSSACCFCRCAAAAMSLVLLSAKRTPRFSMKELIHKADLLEKRYQLEFPAFHAGF